MVPALNCIYIHMNISSTATLLPFVIIWIRITISNLIAGTTPMVFTEDLPSSFVLFNGQNT
jgi:hypothetical protein